MRELSVSWTWWYKYVLPSLWIGVFATVSIVMFIRQYEAHGLGTASSGWDYLLGAVAGGLVLYWVCMRTKRVRVDGRTLLISNYMRDIEVPLASVAEVTQGKWANPEMIYIKFRTPTEFGSQIVFVPPQRWGRGFSEHPILAELRDLIAAAGERAPI